MNKEIFRTIKFTLFSISAGIVQVLSFTALTELTAMKYWPCYLISLLLSVLWNFTLNRKYTFKSASNVPIAMAKVLLFYALFTPASTILGNHAAETLLWNEYLIMALTMISNFVLEYLYDRFVVFGTSLDTAEGKRK